MNDKRLVMALEIKMATQVAESDPQGDTLIEEVLQNFDCLPVLFVGSGIPRRYLGAPDWDGALQAAAAILDGEAPDYKYLVQRFESDRVRIGTYIGDLIFEWAWAHPGSFPEELYGSKDKYSFIKFLLARQLKGLMGSAKSLIKGEFAEEIAAFKAIRPHAAITTNYDPLIETLLQGYAPIVGNNVLQYNLNTFGEIFHIHGFIDDPESLVLTESDYANWVENSKYFAAKLLTYFAEHPVFILGYGLGDTNVRTILADIGRITADDTGLINNVIQVVYDENMDGLKLGEFAIEESSRQFRLTTITTNSLLNVYKALAAQHELKNVNPALVRALAARVMKLTRKDIPNGEIEVDYAVLERFADDDDELPKMLGLTVADTENKLHPYTLSMVADKLDLGAWQHANKLLKRISDEKGVDLKETDNRYHCKIKTGKSKNSATRKWSQEAVDLLAKVRDEQPYEVQL